MATGITHTVCVCVVQCVSCAQIKSPRERICLRVDAFLWKHFLLILPPLWRRRVKTDKHNIKNIYYLFSSLRGRVENKTTNTVVSSRRSIANALMFDGQRSNARSNVRDDHVVLERVGIIPRRRRVLANLCGDCHSIATFALNRTKGVSISSSLVSHIGFLYILLCPAGQQCVVVV